MPKVKINGVEHEFPPGMNVLEACKKVGIEIPHFCYHPLLKVVGSCRMCKVEVIQNDRKRIDISCNLQVADDMEILTDSPAVKKAQRMTLEYLLINHPLDCPVCDDAGECELQNYYFEYGKHDSRMRELKVRKRKAFDIGKSIVLDSERCVLCSRCVRFLADITHTYELGIFGMGSTEELMLKPDSKLDNDYAGNVVDLCPVGALTDKDFRFKRRVWYLKETPSICQLCSRGCNVRIDWDLNPFHQQKKNYKMRNFRTEQTEMQRIQRIKPRENFDVNGTWICDHGRYGYHPTDAGDRLEKPVIRDGAELKTVEFSDAVKEIASGLTTALKTHKSKVAVALSPKAANEEVFAAWSLFRKKLELPNLDHRIPIDPEWSGDDLLRTPDPFPNRLGCEWIGFLPDENGIGVKDLDEQIIGGKVDTVLFILADPKDVLDVKSLKKLKRVYAIIRNLPDESMEFIDAALPAAAWGEYSGTFANFEGRIQRFEKAFDALGESKPVWQWIIDLSTVMKKSLRWDQDKDILNSLAENVHYFKDLTFEKIGSKGMLLGDKNQD